MGTIEGIQAGMLLMFVPEEKAASVFLVTGGKGKDLPELMQPARGKAKKIDLEQD